MSIMAMAASWSQTFIAPKVFTMSSSENLRSGRERLGPVGVWLGVLGRAPIAEERQAARRIEELGLSETRARGNGSDHRASHHSRCQRPGGIGPHPVSVG